MQKFVLAGKTSTVFRLIEMMVNGEQGEKLSSSPEVHSAAHMPRFLGCHHAMGGYKMVDLKGITRCKRCHGNLFWERDIYGVHLACLQCGAEHPVPVKCEQPVQRHSLLRGNSKEPEGYHHLVRV